MSKEIFLDNNASVLLIENHVSVLSIENLLVQKGMKVIHDKIMH